MEMLHGLLCKESLDGEQDAGPDDDQPDQPVESHQYIFRNEGSELFSPENFQQIDSEEGHHDDQDIPVRAFVDGICGVFLSVGAQCNNGDPVKDHARIGNIQNKTFQPEQDEVFFGAVELLVGFFFVFFRLFQQGYRSENGQDDPPDNGNDVSVFPGSDLADFGVKDECNDDVDEVGKKNPDIKGNSRPNSLSDACFKKQEKYGTDHDTEHKTGKDAFE